MSRIFIVCVCENSEENAVFTLVRKIFSTWLVDLCTTQKKNTKRVANAFYLED